MSKRRLCKASRAKARQSAFKTMDHTRIKRYLTMESVWVYISKIMRRYVKWWLKNIEDVKKRKHTHTQQTNKQTNQKWHSSLKSWPVKSQNRRFGDFALKAKSKHRWISGPLLCPEGVPVQPVLLQADCKRDLHVIVQQRDLQVPLHFRSQDLEHTSQSFSVEADPTVSVWSLAGSDLRLKSVQIEFYQTYPSLNTASTKWEAYMKSFAPLWLMFKVSMGDMHSFLIVSLRSSRNNPKQIFNIIVLRTWISRPTMSYTICTKKMQANKSTWDNLGFSNMESWKPSNLWSKSLKPWTQSHAPTHFSASVTPRQATR